MLHADMRRVDSEFDAACDRGAITDRERARFDRAWSAYCAAAPLNERECGWKLIEAANILKVLDRPELVACVASALSRLRRKEVTVRALHELQEVADADRHIPESFGHSAVLIESALKFLRRPRLVVRND